MAWGAGRGSTQFSPESTVTEPRDHAAMVGAAQLPPLSAYSWLVAWTSEKHGERVNKTSFLTLYSVPKTLLDTILLAEDTLRIFRHSSAFNASGLRG